jgi:dihydroxy-acid dehydratase
MVEIDIPARTLRLAVDDAELERRRAAMQRRGADAWRPATRVRKGSPALQAYAALTTSAARGAVRDVSQLQPSARAAE